MADNSLQVTSSMFSDGETIPSSAAHSMVGGENISPDLSWTAGPSGTKSYVLTCHDPDAPTTVGFTHWILLDIPASVTSLERGAEGPGVLGFTDWGESKYGGMAPPAGDLPHHYHFTIYALDVDSLGAGPTATYALTRFMIRGKILAEGTLTGLYSVPQDS